MAAVVLTALLLPALSLVPLGSLWLWERGYLLHWAAGATLAVAAMLLVQRQLLRPALARPREKSREPGIANDAGAASAAGAPDLGWTEAERRAWADVEAIVARLEPAELTSRDAILALGIETVDAVARSLHQGATDAVWRFTVPEACAILERVSRRVGGFVSSSVPLGDRLTVAQALALYRWKGAVSTAEKAYDIWRLIRLANPLTAATQEIRERMSKDLLEWGQQEVVRRVAEVYVRETGRAAIDLYGGRLGISEAELASTVTPASRDDLSQVDARAAEPLRILVAGQAGAGKSSLVNALAGGTVAAVDAVPTTAGFDAHWLRRDGFPPALVIDSPAAGTDPKVRALLCREAMESDLIIWVSAAHRADRANEADALAAIRGALGQGTRGKAPPMLLVSTNIDRLPPFGDATADLDLAGSSPKAVAIRAATAATATDLGFTADAAIPVSLAPGATANLEVVWQKLATLLPAAQSVHLLRRIESAKAARGWRRVWSQATNASRAVGSAMIRRRAR